jgi:sirohydrochlorin cobaltochelatase
MSHGLILFAHGARDPRWAAPFEDTAARIRAQRPQLPVRTAYLEFMSPDLPAAVADLAAGGCTVIDVLPMFLGSGGHVRRDLPALLDGLRQRHPGLSLRLHAAVGEMPSVVQAMADAALAATAAGTRAEAA